MSRLPTSLVADAHVDALMRMDLENLSFYGATELQAGFDSLQHGNVKTQVFAIFADSRLSPDAQLYAVLRQIDMFHRKIIGENIRFVASQQSLHVTRTSGCIAGLLSIEGAACLHADVKLLNIFHQLGICGLGLTWNGSNDLGDGCREIRGAGLTSAGRTVIRELERLSMWIDIAHLSDAGVSDILNMTNGMVMASHANCRRIYNHPRNLPDDTIRELIRRDGWMGVTFEASFVSGNPGGIESIFHHLDHILSLGGENHVGFGSDFDGSLNSVPGLETAADYAVFAEHVLKRYGEPLGHRILFKNFEGFLMRQLPNGQ